VSRSKRIVGLIGIVSLLAALPAAGQTARAGRSDKAKNQAAAERWVAPRTPDGHPDLQGVWISISATPLERPKGLENKPLLTDEEVAELKKRAARIFKTGNSDFAAGDNVFLAAFNNVDQFKSPTATHGAEEMIEREFDNRTSLVVDPPDGRIPSMTPNALQRQDAIARATQLPARAEDLNNAQRCISWSMPRLGGRYGAGDLAYYQIFQNAGYVVIYLEIGHEARIIPLDGRPRLSQGVRQWNGDSRGRWDGDTLVVDTTNFSSKSNFMTAAEGLHVVERFTRTAPDRIKYEIRVEDPATWTRPWSAEMPLKQSREALFEYACHEGNFEMVSGMLSAARVKERAAREAGAGPR
jgi:hypothetical protein